jgi:meso-butanediol dehydrogenase / (S,S)-butanediol dehydrogenase / diacetyl reductase
MVETPHRLGRLSGEVALVTGATAGIGREIARLFAAEGAQVAITGRNVDRGRAVVDTIEQGGGVAAFRAAELEQEGEVNDLVVWTVEEFGGLTVLVNNAATSDVPDSAIHDFGTDSWERILRIDLTAAAWLCRAAIKAMLPAGRGTIVNISSRAGTQGIPAHAAYTAAKGGLDALTRSIAVDYASSGIRCNAIAAGYVLNEVRDRDLNPTRRSQLEARHLTRVGTARDVANAALFLAGDESDWITGITLPVDGGSTIARAASFG